MKCSFTFNIGRLNLNVISHRCLEGEGQQRATTMFIMHDDTPLCLEMLWKVP